MNKFNHSRLFNSILKYCRANPVNATGFIIFVFIIGAAIGQTLYKDYQSRRERENDNELREKNLITGIAKARQYADNKDWRSARSAITLPWSYAVLPVTQNSKIADSLYQYYSIFIDSIDAFEARQRDSIAAIEARQRVISAAGRYYAEKILLTTGPPYFETRGEPYLNITVKFLLFNSGKFRFRLRLLECNYPYRTLIEEFGEGTFTVDKDNQFTFIEDNSSILKDYPRNGQRMDYTQHWVIADNKYDAVANDGFVFFKEN